MLRSSHSLVHYAKGTRSRVTILANRHSASTACWLTVSGPISLPSPGYFSTFPHGTCALSVTKEFLAWARGRARFTQGFTCPVLLGYSKHRAKEHLLTGLVTFCGGPFQALQLSARTKRASNTRLHNNPTTPRQQRVSAITPPGFGLLPVRSPLLGQSRLIYFPAGTEMFHFTAFGLPCLCIGHGIPADKSGRVAPFGDLRISACLRLPGAYRSLPRPSSLVETKASTVQLLVA